MRITPCRCFPCLWHAADTVQPSPPRDGADPAPSSHSSSSSSSAHDPELLPAADQRLPNDFGDDTLRGYQAMLEKELEALSKEQAYYDRMEA